MQPLCELLQNSSRSSTWIITERPSCANTMCMPKRIEMTLKHIHVDAVLRNTTANGPKAGTTQITMHQICSCDLTLLGHEDE